jgi:hypothetical protein
VQAQQMKEDDTSLAARQRDLDTAVRSVPLCLFSCIARVCDVLFLSVCRSDCVMQHREVASLQEVLATHSQEQVALKEQVCALSLCLSVCLSECGVMVV